MFGAFTQQDIEEAKKMVAEHKRLRDSQQMALVEVRQERHYQDELWGGPTHDDQHSSHDWIAYIVHQVGKAQMHPFNPAEFRKRMVKVAAVAVAAVEWSDRMVEYHKEGNG